MGSFDLITGASTSTIEEQMKESVLVSPQATALGTNGNAARRTDSELVFPSSKMKQSKRPLSAAKTTLRESHPTGR